MEDSWEGRGDRGGSLRGAGEKLQGNSAGPNLAGRATHWLLAQSQNQNGCPLPSSVSPPDMTLLSLVVFRLSHVLMFSYANLLILEKNDFSVERHNNGAAD